MKTYSVPFTMSTHIKSTQNPSRNVSCSTKVHSISYKKLKPVTCMNKILTLMSTDSVWQGHFSFLNYIMETTFLSLTWAEKKP